MPIDLKWVRSDPDQVREWQNLRRNNDDNENVDLVETVLHKDEVSRKNLLTLQEHKKSLKQVQMALRPKKPRNGDGSETNTTTADTQELSREDLLHEKKAIETKIRSAEADWKASLEETQRALCTLASPVTVMKQNGDDYDLDANQVSVTPVSLPVSGNTRTFLAMDLEQAWKQYTLRCFSSYLSVEMPRGIPVVETPLDDSQLSGDDASIHLDRALELWGCFSTQIPTTDQTPSHSQADNRTIAILPSWIRLFAEFLPNKSIWGEKELPRFTAIWSRGKQNSAGVSGTFSLDLLAVMAPSVVDAREIQNKLIQELLEYYNGLLTMSKSRQQLKRILVAPPDLQSHERSRIEIHLPMNSSNDKVETLRLGWVSHWGDAATRACDMAFAGGGVVQAGGKKKYKASRNASSKEYVHLVEASVVDESTWNKILCANSSASCEESTDLSLTVPSVLVPHLVRTLSGSLRVPWSNLFLDEKSKKKTKESVFGVLGGRNDCQKKRQESPVNPSKSNSAVGDRKAQSIFPPLGAISSLSREELQTRARLEKLSCPYDFLFE